MSELSVAARIASRSLDVQFAVDAGEVLAVLGPNGAGKSTTAAVVAGLVRADEAMVRVGDRVVTDTAHGVHVAPHDRRVGLLLQKPLLFPHLDVLGNVAFATRRGAGRSRARATAMEWLTTVGAAEFAGRRPAQLSGGQAQRVAIARALASQPDVLILDEPLTGLDVGTAASVRRVLQSVLTAGDQAVVLITHDLLDVLALADRALVLDEGKVTEESSVAGILAAPRSAFAARMAGINLVRGILTDVGTLRCADGTVWHGRPEAAGFGGMHGKPAVAVFRPGAVAVYRDQPHGSPRNCVQVRVESLEVAGAVVRVRAQPVVDDDPGLAADVTPEAVAELRLAVGQQMWFTVKAQEVALHPDSRRRGRGQR